MASKHQLKMQSDGGAAKRRHKTLTIQEKVDLLKKLDAGASVKNLCKFYGVGSSTVYDIKKQKKQLCKFYAGCESRKGMENRRTMKEGKSVDLDTELIQWFRLRRSEGLNVSGPMLMEQAKVFHRQLQLPFECEYSQGWLHKFKRRHGITLHSAAAERLSTDQEAAEKFIEEFSKLVVNEKLSPEQVYNADETALCWSCIPKKTLATGNNIHSGMKELKERVTVLGSWNAAGTHKIKLLVIGKSLRPRAFSGIKVFPVEYRASKNGSITGQILRDWFEKTFVPQARQHCSSLGLDPNCKILLILDNCSAYPSADTLVKDDVFVLFLPPNCTSILHPQGQGILRSLTCRYRSEFLRKFLSDIHGNCNKSVVEIRMEYNLKDVIWGLAHAWDSIPRSILKKAWYKLWPELMFEDEGNSEMGDFTGFRISHEKLLVNELVEYARSITNPDLKELNAENVEEWLDADKDFPVIHLFTDEEILEMRKNKDKFENNSEAEENHIMAEERISLDECIRLTTRLIAGLEQHNFISEQQIMNIHIIQSQLIREKQKYMKQPQWIDMFKNVSETREVPNIPEASSSAIDDEMPSTSSV
nr:TOM1-like protein 2 isoform X1 [Pelodiscus sinensis]|eukprot:XP_006126666.1 TOM1-like protein 2 isoform X1 [Pelodiscus sinensis]